MKTVYLSLIFIVLASCNSKKSPVQGETEWQQQKNAFFKDASTSPLTETDLKTFISLNFFPFNEDYVVTAKLKRTPDSEWFNMPTTTSRMSKERIYGILEFELQGQSFQLNIYQGAEYLNTPGQENMLFLPFLDDTNGQDTYGGGRYIEVEIPAGDILEIDFNRAFNPYCHYNQRYSCPIVPRENYLSTRVEAGEKTYKKAG